MINPKKDFSFYLIRRPLLNLNVLKEWFEAEVPENYVRDKFKQPQLLEALYLASRSLHQRATLLGAPDDKSLPPGPERSALTLALAKYLTRAAFRCTPYGLFASIQKAAIGDTTSPRPVALRRSVHLDGGVETRLVERLLAIPAVRRSAQWVFNSTYVILGHSDRATYVGVQKTEKHQRKFVSSEAEHDWVLDQIKGFCQTPKPYLEIENLLSELNTGSEEERHEYIEQVIEAGILIPALPNVVSSVSALQRLFSWIAPAGDFEAIRESLEILAGAESWDSSDDAVANYESLVKRLGKYIEDLAFSAGPVQVDACSDQLGTVDARVAERIAGACRHMENLLSVPIVKLDQFRKAFEERFEEAEVPLMFALDQDWGIPFPSQSRTESAFLDGMFPARYSGGRMWGRRDTTAFSSELVKRTLGANASELEQGITFTSDELERLSPQRSGTSSATRRWALASVSEAGTGEEPTIQMLVTAGVSGTEVMGRFGTALAPLADDLVALHAARAASEPDVLFAEILHQPQDRVLNVVRRPRLTEYEIVLSGASELPRERQIWLEDLTLSVKDGSLRLRHVGTGREVRPCLTTMHNYSSNQMGLYQFLGALANVGQQNCNFEWPKAVAHLRRLPRVTFDSVVVSRALWMLDRADLAQLAASADKASRRNWRKVRGMPRFVTYDVEDNWLPIDLDSAMSVEVALDELADATQATFHEAIALNLADADASWGQREVYEVALPLESSQGMPVASTWRASSESPNLDPATYASRIEQSFDSWVYAKIFVSAMHSDRLLAECIHPVMQKAASEGHLQKWFFVRYNSGGEHLRLRFRAASRASMHEIQSQLNDGLRDFRRRLLVSRVLFDDYKPEFSRYGGDAGTALCEALFQIDSEDVGALLRLEGSGDWTVPRWLGALAALDHYAGLQAWEDCGRQEVLKLARDHFVHEQLPAAASKFKLGARFRNLRAEVDALTRNTGPFSDQLGAWQLQLRANDDRRRASLSKLDAVTASFGAEYRRSLLISLLHMQANRLFIDQQRRYEAIAYDFLVRIDDARRVMAIRAPAPAYVVA